MFKKVTVTILLLAGALLPAAPFFVSGPRNEINLAGKDWRKANADTFNLERIPSGLKWEAAEIPTREDKTGIQSVNSYGYPPRPQEYFEKDQKTFKIRKNLSAWYRKTFEVPGDALKNHTAHLNVGYMAFRSGVWINGRKAYESVQAALPHDIDVTKYLKPGKNEILVAITGREGIVDAANMTYYAPSGGITVGIHRKIQLEFRPVVAVDDVFVKTSVRKPQIEFETTIANRGSREVTVTPRAVIRTRMDRQVLTAITGNPVRIAPGKSVTANLKSNWKAPVLWDLATPVLYDADIQLIENGKLADSYLQPFGYREFEIRGRDFYLNGRRVTLLRNSPLKGLDNPRHEARMEHQELNSSRLHLGFCNSDVIRLGDEQGNMIVPESSWNWVNLFPADKADAWMPGTLEYFKGWIKYLRNHPSIVIWSLANETFWGRTKPEEMAVGKKIIEAVRAMDPTRPLQGDAEADWNGQLDIINIHYPENHVGEINRSYINSYLNMPNDAKYLVPGKQSDAMASKFTWTEKPLVIGEYFCDNQPVEEYSSFMGDDVFNGEKWRRQEFSGRGRTGSDDHMNNLYAETLKKYTTEYRMRGVAGMNIWTPEKDPFMPRYLVRPYDFHPSAEAGRIFKRKIAVVNDGEKPLRSLQCILTFNGSIVWEKFYKFYMHSGSRQEITVEVPIPATDRPGTAELTVRLNTWPNEAYPYYEVGRFSEKIAIVPDYNLSALKSRIAVLGDSPALRRLLKLYKLDGVSGKITNETKLVLVAGDSFRKEMAEALDRFTENGGVAVILPQKNWTPYRLELPERDKDHAATQAWVRTPSHPLLKNMQPGQFSFWRPDNVVTRETLKKPLDGAFELPLDCGGRFGMRWTPLIDVPIGKGAVILTTFDLEKAAFAEPGAKQLFANMLEYGVSRIPRTTAKLNVPAHKNKALKDALDLTGAAVEEGVGTAGPILLDASAEIAPELVTNLKKALADGRVLWLRGFTPETVGKVASLLPFKPILEKSPADVPGAVLTKEDPLTCGLANFDFWWYRGSAERAGWRPLKIIAKSGDWVLNAPWNADVTRLTSPAYLTKIKAGKGAILFDTLQWEKATSVETDKALRIASLLAKNMGGEFKTKENVHYKRFFVDLSKHANMGYYDKVENDGRGGWTDQGRNDMRFFLTNHTGRAGGEDNAAAVPVPPFPEKVDFNKAIYRLIDPKKNGGKAVISLGSDRFGTKLPKKTEAIAVNEKADILWFLHTIGWSPKEGDAVAEYTVRYKDGSRVKIPVRFAMEVGDWHSPKGYSSSSVAWTGRNLFTSPVGLWTFPWKNPHPEKEIVSLTLEGNKSQAQYVLLAITGGVKGSGEDAVIADWNFGEKTSTIPYQKSQKPPVPGKDGAVFGKGTFLQSETKGSGIAGGMREPFSVFADITPLAKPDGYCGGIIEMCHYLNDGFRLVIGKGDLKVCMEIYVAPGKAVYLSSKSPVELGKRSTWEVRFDGKKAIMLKNGKIESIIDSPFPRPFKEGVATFGRASGNEYNFNGTIHRVSIKKLN